MTRTVGAVRWVVSVVTVAVLGTFSDVRAGELIVNATTEQQCFYLDPESRCLSYFQQVNITGSSGEQSIVLGEASPAPTATPIGHDGDDGCSVARPGPTDALPLLPLIAPALLLQLARRRRAGAPT